MAYTVINFRTKKALLEAVKAGEQIEVFQPGPFPLDKSYPVSLEGPHYPEAHTWYAAVKVNEAAIIQEVS